MKQLIAFVGLAAILISLGSVEAKNIVSYGQAETMGSDKTIAIVPVGNEVARTALMPMYDAFKRFCIDTGAQPDAVDKAVRISGIRFHKRGPSSTTSPMSMGDTAWDMDFEGHKLALNAGHAAEPSGPAMVQKSNACTIISWNSDETASVAALHRWAGITRSADRQMRRGGRLTLYEFETRGMAILPLKNDEAGRLAKAEGEHGFSPSWIIRPC